MKQFSHKVNLNKRAIEIEGVNKRIKRHSIMFTLTFVLLILGIASYIIYNIAISKYEGYIVCKNIKLRLTDDIVVAEYFVNPGDVVNEGDTIFSYIIVPWLAEAINPNTIITSDLRAMDAKIRRNRLESQLNMMKKNADSLQKLVQFAKQEVELGIAIIQDFEKKQWEYVQINEQIEHTKRLIEIENEITTTSKDYCSYSSDMGTVGSYTYSELINKKESFGHAYAYRRAFADMKIVDLNSNLGDVVYTKEPVLTFYPYNDPKMSDLHVKLLLPPDDVSKIKNGDMMTIFSGKECLGEAQVVLSSPFVKEVESYKLSTFSNKREAVVVRMKLNDDAKFPDRFEIDNLPVAIYFYNWKSLDSDNILRKFMEWINI